jgi:hypothetical protein
MKKTPGIGRFSFSGFFQSQPGLLSHHVMAASVSASDDSGRRRDLMKPAQARGQVPQPRLDFLKRVEA